MTTNVISLRQLGVWVGEDQTNSYRRDADEATLPLERLTINLVKRGVTEVITNPL
ncbi:hypothetical protein [Coleofasciculus sp.]|uniref:hypothetical protein n=1 Tax=Coleofasciculus sp. TaxID=3100458 RepID=UPI003A234CEF